MFISQSFVTIISLSANPFLQTAANNSFETSTYTKLLCIATQILQELAISLNISINFAPAFQANKLSLLSHSIITFTLRVSSTTSSIWYIYTLSLCWISWKSSSLIQMSNKTQIFLFYLAHYQTFYFFHFTWGSSLSVIYCPSTTVYNYLSCYGRTHYSLSNGIRIHSMYSQVCCSVSYSCWCISNWVCASSKSSIHLLPVYKPADAWGFQTSTLICLKFCTP